jgi:hypothetical protein
VPAEKSRPKVESTDVREPHRESQRTEQGRDRVHARSTGTQEEDEIVEQRMGHGLERDETRLAAGRRGRERPEPLVLPADVRVAIRAMRDAEAALTRQSDEPPVAEQRPEHHLELHLIRRHPTKRDRRRLDHTRDGGRRLRCRMK